MTDIENHMVDGPVKEYEGDRDPNIEANITRIVESLDNDELAEMLNDHATSDFDIDWWDSIRLALLEDEEHDKANGELIGKALLDEFRRQIQKRAES